MNAITKGGYQDVPMTRRRAQLLEEYASKLADMLEAAPNDKDLAEWVQSKIDRAAAAIQSAYHYLDQDDESELEKARVLKYDYRRPSKTRFNKKTGKREWDYFYTKKHGARVTRGAFEAGAAFRMTWKGRKGHFHIHHVKGDQVFITHDSRPDMEPIPVQADELRALLERQHKREVDQHLKRKTRKVEEIKRRAHRGGLGLALHRLRQAAAQAGVSLPEQYQRKPKKTRAKVAETAREVETQAPKTKRGHFTPSEMEEMERYESYLFGEAEDRTAYLKQLDLSEIEAKINKVQTFYDDLRESNPVVYRKRNKHKSYRELQDLKRYVRTRKAEGRLKGEAPATETPDPEPLQVKEQTPEERKAGQQAFEQLFGYSLEPTTPRDQLTSTAQQIIEDANQEHAERHEEHQEITRFELGEHTHAKTGAKLYTAKQTERVDRDEYFRRLEIAKQHGGRYERRYVRGFVFKNAEDARAFALEVEGAAPPETSAETVTPHDEHPGADNFETMPEVEAPRSSAREQLTETAGQATAPSSPLDIDQANAQDTLTENRTRAPESKAADKALIESARELAKTSERGEEIKSALVDLMNAQQLKRYKRATGDTRARAEDMIEKRREARERLRAATSGEVINNFETMPEVEAQPKKRSVKQEAREAQEARLIQQKTFDNETQGKITEVYSVLKDRVRLNKKGEVYAIKKPSTLYYGETPTGALAGAVSSATGLSRSAAYNIVNEAVGERRTLAEIQDLLGAQIVEEKKELIRKRPAAIRMLIRNLHTNTREKIRTYTAQFNPAMRHDQRSGIGLESIDLALDKREIARNVSIYGTQDSVLTEEERRKVTYTTMMSAVSVVDRIAARYGNIAELRADAEGVKQTLETFARAALESIKESAERDLRYVKGKIDAGIKDIKETDFKRDMLEARLARAERETSFLDDPEATREEIREIREGLDEAEQILREDTERTAQWYSAEAQRRLAENSVKTMGELTAAIKSGTARRYIEAAVEGSAKEKLAARMFNEIMERLLVETKDQPIEQPPLDTPEPVEKPEGRVSAIASVIDRQAEERAERRQRRLKDKQRALRKTPIHKSITEALVNSLVVESDHAGTQGPTIKKLTDSKQSAVKNILLKTIADTVGTETRGKARELLMKQALGLGGATTGESRRFDSMLVKIQEALTPQMPLARARREVEEIVKRTMVHNLSTSIEKVLKRYVAPQATTSTKRPMSLPHYRDLPVPETPLRDYRMTALYGAAYDRLARKYLSGRELEADAAEIKAKTKQAFRQRLDAQRSRNRDKYNEAFLEATNPNRDTADQRVQVLDHVQAMISTLGLESERGQAGVSLRDQVEQIKRTAERNRAGYQAEIDANAQKQAEDLRYLKEEIKPKIMGDQAPAAEAQLLQDYLNDIEDSHNRTGFETKRGRRFAEIQREALQELINELQSTPPKRISEFGEDLDARQSTDIRATPPARQALTETVERVTSDQTAEQATTRATPRPSEETLRGSGELDETVRANLQDRAQFLLRMPEDTTKTGRRSKRQKARDGELLLIHRRLQSDAQERLGPTAPRFADYSQLIGMPRADQPENAETRAQFRTALKDAIRELEQATSGQVTKSARPLITYRAQLIQTVERLTAA